MRQKDLFPYVSIQQCNKNTLQRTNISLAKALFKIVFPFPRWIMLVLRRVTQFVNLLEDHQILDSLQQKLNSIPPSNSQLARWFGHPSKLKTLNNPKL